MIWIAGWHEERTANALTMNHEILIPAEGRQSRVISLDGGGSYGNRKLAVLAVIEAEAHASLCIGWVEVK